jgi:hypothetical protein
LNLCLRKETIVAIKVKMLFLDPHCVDVAIKSAESDGVGMDWAHRHINECKCCSEYDKLVRANMKDVADDHESGNLVRMCSANTMSVRIPKGIKHVHFEAP